MNHGSRWTDVTPILAASPQNRTLGAMVWDAEDGYVLLFGGCGTANTCNGADLGDTWAFSNATWTELSPTNSPSGRAIAQIAYDAADHEVVLFGGLYGYSTASSEALNDTWTFSHGQWTNISSKLTTAPNPRYRASMVYDAADGYVVLFGGTYSSLSTVPDKDTWTFANQTWTNVTTTVTGAPPGRYRAAAAYDAADREVVVFGGCLSSVNCPTSLTWVYSAGAWTNLTSTLTKAPAARVYPTMTYDARDGYVLLFGGSHTTTGAPIYDDTWKFVNNTWTNLTASLSPAPPAAGQGQIAFDAGDNLTVFNGGFDYLTQTTVGYGATWSFGPPIIGYASIAPARIDANQTATVTVSVVDDSQPVSYNYTLLPSGCVSKDTAMFACAPSLPFSGRLQANVTDPFQENLSFSVSLVAVPDPSIVIASVNLTNVTVGSSVQFSVNATGGMPPYRYGYLSLPSGCTSQNVDNLTCTPTTAGNQSVGLVATDSAGYSVSKLVKFRVNPKPSVVTFTSSVPTTDVGLPIVFTTTTAGGTAPLHYLYTGLPAGCLSSDSPSLNCVPTAAGDSIVQTNVSDAFGWYATATAAVTVSPAIHVNGTALSLGSIDAGTLFTVWVNATGGTNPLSYSYNGLPTGCSLNGTSTGTCRAPNAGTFTITATVTDPVGGRAVSEANLTVVPDPTVTQFTVGPAATDLGLAATFNVVAVNGTPSYNYLYRGLPLGCVSNDTAVLLCRATGTGRATVQVTVTDALSEHATATAVLVVNPDLRVSSFNSTPSAWTLGASTTFDAVVTGGTGDLSFSYTGLPTGCASVNASQLSCVATATGTFTAVVTVTDSVGSSVSSNTTVVVNAKPSSTSGLLNAGGSSSGLLLLALAAVAIAVVAVLLLMRRRKAGGPAPEAPAPPPEPPAEPWEET